MISYEGGQKDNADHKRSCTRELLIASDHDRSSQSSVQPKHRKVLREEYARQLTASITVQITEEATWQTTDVLHPTSREKVLFYLVTDSVWHPENERQH